MNKYYVYYHTDADGRVFYVGKGSGDRAYSKVGRSAAWSTRAVSGYTVGFYATELSEQDAYSLETEIISTPLDWELVNTVSSFTTIEIDYAEAHSLYVYSDISPSGLILKDTNKFAGNLSTSGYWNVQYCGKKVRAHRLIWVLFNFYIPHGMYINHIDSNRGNNRISNLELVTPQQNSSKRRDRTHGVLQPNNTSGVLGICEYTHPYSGQLYARAQWRDVSTGTRKDKKFSYAKYGKERAWELAIEHRQTMLHTLP